MQQQLIESYEILVNKFNIYEKTYEKQDTESKERYEYLDASMNTFLLLVVQLGLNHPDVILAKSIVSESFRTWTDHDIMYIIKKYV